MKKTLFFAVYSKVQEGMSNSKNFEIERLIRYPNLH